MLNCNTPIILDLHMHMCRFHLARSTICQVLKLNLK